MPDYKLRCITCKREYKKSKGLYTCNDCGDLLGTLEVIYDFSKSNIKKDFKSYGSMFQFSEFLPVKSHTEIDQYIGGTPLLSFKNIFGLDELLIKFDGISFSGSYKDRASIIAINMAIEEGNKNIFCASTGNAASSLGLLSAHTDLNTYIFVPSKIPKGKLAQLQASGATILAVDLCYDEVFDLSLSIGLKKGWYTRNSAINPFLLEGKKTGAFEIIVQNDYIAPDYVFVGVGDGTIISSLCKGFSEFLELGLINKLPKVIGVQASGSSTLKKVFDNGEPFIPIEEVVHTVADSVSVGNPRDVIKACKYIKENGGKFISVSDDEIINSVLELSKKTGVFAEPAGAISLAGFKKMMDKEEVRRSDSVCLFVTGNGLKDIDALGSSCSTKIYSKEEVEKHFMK